MRISTGFAAVAIVLGVCLAVVPLGSTRPAAAAGARAADGMATAAGTGSAVTVSGTGPFASLRVTVSQTKELTDQAVTVSWTGGTPTQPAEGDFALDYLQIMQCWGDSASGPDRTQCQFGGLYTDTRGGNWANTRQLSYGSTLVDPAETITTPAPGSSQVYVPFKSVTGKQIDTGSFNEFYDANTTNELPFARTGNDGTGLVFFEVQTSLEAPGLGCGEPLKAAGGTVVGRACWLVVVPRNDIEVDGSVRTTQSNFRLESSPLSATNWAHRMVVPLQFEPIGTSCPLGSAERRTVGSEFLTEAINRWQPALCANRRPVFGFSQVADDVARRQLLATDPGMVFLSEPEPADKVSAIRPIVYAPVALSGLVIAFNVERRAAFDAPADVAKLDGQRFATMSLTPRLVAKLLSESYRFGAYFNAPYLVNNPEDLSRDPDFLQYNPDFKDQDLPAIGDALEPLVESDSTTLLWKWINADHDARAFLDGTPDPWGMTVNPKFTGIALPVNSYPKNDQYCHTIVGVPPVTLCALDEHPYANDMHDSARAASRGDTKANTDVNVNVTPPVLKKAPPQLPGERALLAITDVATAARYGLPVAKLRNGAGDFVAPTTGALLAGAAVMKPSSPSGVLASDPTTTSPGAYPLTTVTYAATAPSAITAAAGRDYASFLRYAASGGQTVGVNVGQLPIGYAPLPAALRDRARSAASTIARTAGRRVSGTPGGGPTTGSGSTPSAPVTPSSPTSGSPPAGPPSPSPVASGPVFAAVYDTPGTPIGRARYLLAVLLVLGGLTAGVGPILLRTANRRRR